LDSVPFSSVVFSSLSYAKAAEACKSASDSEWLAGCLEGLNAAQWASSERNPSAEDVSEIVERQQEAVTLYRKRKVCSLISC
jgi:hypothetical protein